MLPTAQAQLPLLTQVTPPAAATKPASKPATATPSATASANSTAQLIDPPSRHVASAAAASATTGPSLELVAIALALLGALATAGYAVARRRQRAYPRRVGAHRGTRRGFF